MIGQDLLPQRGASVDHVRNLNLRTVLDVIKARGPISRAEITRLLDLSAPTVSSLVSELEEAGLVQKARKGDAEKGRPPDLIRFDEHAGYVLGLDLSAARMRAALATLSGQVVGAAEEPHNRFGGVTTTLQQCSQLLQRLRANSGFSPTKVLALGVAMPGIINSATGEVVLARNLVGWQHVPLGNLLQEALGLPVVVENDLRLAALGEYAYGAARGYRSFILVGFCEGMGSAIMIDGQLLRGEHFMAGEIGFMRTNLHAPQGPGADRDYLESIVGMGMLREMVAEAMRRGRKSALESALTSAEHSLQLETILAAAAQGDSLALEISDLLARALSFAIANMVSVCDPSLVVLNDRSVNGAFSLLSQVQRSLTDHLPFQPAVVVSPLGPEAVLAGALHMAGEKAEAILLNRRRSET